MLSVMASVRFPPIRDLNDVRGPPVSWLQDIDCVWQNELMKPAWKRTAAATLIGSLVSGCTFGMLKADKCLQVYQSGMVEAALQARSKGPLSEESYGFCLDGHARAEAMLPSLSAHGFETEGPTKHFEVPGGWCLSARRLAVSERFDPNQSLHSVCAIGEASRAYLTGGTLRTVDGTPHYVRSTYDREAMEALEKRLANKTP